MAQVAICPNCDFEFQPTDDATSGEVIDCPACGTSFELHDEYMLPREPQVAEHALDIASSAENLDPAERRIEKWFRSAETVADVGAESSRAGITEPPSQPASHDESDRPTVEAASDSVDSSMSDADEVVELAPSEPLPQQSATWDDSERMERLLADIDAQPADDYLPVSREPRPHDDQAETLEYSSLDEAPPDAVRLELRDRDAADEEAPAAAPAEVAISASPRTRRRRSPLRTIVGSGVAGLLGLAVGYLALLWMLGPTGDVLNAARWLPPAILPASLREPPQLASRPPADMQGQAEQRPTSDVVNANASETLPAPGESRERQASFETPAAPAGAGDTRAQLGERYAKRPAEPAAPIVVPREPSRIEEPAATAPSGDNRLPQQSMTITGAPTYSIEQFDAALRAARDAQPGLLAGELDDKTVQHTKGLSFGKLCELAETATFIDPSQSSAAAPTTSAAETLFKDTLADPRIRREVARIVPIWIGSAHRRHGGVFFAGSIVGRNEHGAMTECQVDLGAGTTLSVLAPPAQISRAGFSRNVIVVGSLIDKPAERIAGYSTAAPQVVWASSLIPLE